MREYKSLVIALIAAVSAVACVSIFTGGLLDYKKTGGGSGITATGSASCDFESDLIVWRGSFSVHGDTPKDAYSMHFPRQSIEIGLKIFQIERF